MKVRKKQTSVKRHLIEKLNIFNLNYNKILFNFYINYFNLTVKYLYGENCYVIYTWQNCLNSIIMGILRIMKNTIDWTADKIELLKVAFLQGNQLKQIAKTLGKTASALNKALDRFGIRSQKRKRQYIEWSPSDPHCQSGIPSFIGFEKKKETPVGKKILCFKHRRKSKDDSVWVALPEVVSYVRNKGVPLKSLAKPLTPDLFSEAQFILNHKPLTALQLLFMANEFRLAEKQPIFLVSEVSW